ncbi:TIGR00730 family Rossman fold protein [Halomonas sp. PR-M31]|uniref:LOG family protein n=1 Tax=Halomonas sp. PR-M31 TaxID=1471202 RepID=UPI00065140F0|nr:TIGR00730 family Rossman fold protein [Halomonas sp. PR-M31]
MRRVCVYLGAREGHDPRFREAAMELGTRIATRGFGLVYGGAHIGLMGIVANAALEAGGEVIGVIPHHLIDREMAHTGLSQLIKVDNMHERKAIMAEHADAFIAMPGGIGTLEELFEVWTWQYLGLHDKPIGVLDVAGFYQPLLGFMDDATNAGFLATATRAKLQSAGTPDALLDILESQL